MDPNQVVSNQLPDENKIKQMFPKCPPTTPSKKTFSNSTRKTPKRVQLHSRKVLEDRRNRIRATQQKQQQQSPQYQHGQQSPRKQHPQLDRHLTQQSLKGKSTDSSDDTTSGRSQNNVCANNYNHDNFKKNGHISKQTRYSHSSSQSFPQPSSSRSNSTVTINDSSQHLQEQNVSQPQRQATTYGQPLPALDQTQPPQEPVSTKPTPNLIDDNSFSSSEQQQTSQYPNVKANDTNVVTDNNNNINISVDIEEILSNNDCETKSTLENVPQNIKQVATDDEVDAYGLEKEQQEIHQRPPGMEQRQQQHNLQQERQEQSVTSMESEQYSAVKTAENNAIQDDDHINLFSAQDLSKSIAAIKLNDISSDVNGNGQDRYLGPQLQFNSRSDKCTLEYNEDSSNLNSSNHVNDAFQRSDDIIDFSLTRLPSSVQPLKSLLESDEEVMARVIEQQTPEFNNLEMLNDNSSQYSLKANETVVIENSSDIELIQPKSPTIRLETFSEIDEDNGMDRSISTRVPSLRHHKLPNESSHYSIVRVSSNIEENGTTATDLPTAQGPTSFSTQLSTLPEEGEVVIDKASNSQPGETSLKQSRTATENNNIQCIVRSNINIIATGNNDTSLTPPRSSSLQFNNLSDADESECELRSKRSRNFRHANRKISRMTRKCDSSSLLALSSDYMSHNINKKLQLDDDLVPATKTALIFPCLDEGLSSAAESCDDEVEDDDERAVDADVDADDDDEDDDEDGDEDTIDRDIAALQLGQTNVDCFVRQQQSKNQLRHNGSSQPISTNGRMSEQPNMHQSRSTGSGPFGSYVNQDLFENDADLNKPTTSNYPNHVGQNNHWMGNTAIHHQSNNQSFPTSSTQQVHNQRSNNSMNLMKNSHLSRKDEVRAANRLSSDTDNETDRLLGTQRNEQLKLANNDVNGVSIADSHPVSNPTKHNANSKEVLIEGVLFNVKYLGSTHSDCEGRSDKEDRILQAETAVQEVKFRNGLSPDSQSTTEVQLFISTEKIMVLDDKHRKIMMDHSLRTISYIADIGDAIVLIVRKKTNPNETVNEMGRPISKISCHVFESSESHTITKSISQAFQVAYTELLKANGGGDPNNYLPKELDYQEVLNSQEMSTDELEMFARKENQREVIVPKKEGEIIGFSIVESGWGSVLPTVVIASLKHDGPAYRCKKLFIGDQILSINGVSLVGLPLSECQQILSKIKNQRVARLSVVPCSLVVEVKIKRPDVKYQLGFSVQNGVICSLLRGGIAERGGVRVGHRIISINGTAVVGVPHEKIVTLLASSVGEIRMKTCLTSLYRQILGEENPVYY